MSHLTPETAATGSEEVRGAEPPGMMVGLAGIGYGLLRRAFPERVPSVLLLELPPADAA